MWHWGEAYRIYLPIATLINYSQVSFDFKLLSCPTMVSFKLLLPPTLPDSRQRNAIWRNSFMCADIMSFQDVFHAYPTYRMNSVIASSKECWSSFSHCFCCMNIEVDCRVPWKRCSCIIGLRHSIVSSFFFISFNVFFSMFITFILQILSLLLLSSAI